MSDTTYQEALSELLTYDVGRSAYFDVKFHSTFLGKGQQSLSYLCHSAELPGESVATVSQKIYGVVEKHPIMVSYNDITLSFYIRGVDADITRYEFLNWIAASTGRGSVVSYNGEIKYNRNNRTTYNTLYKNDLSGTIEISHYSCTGKLLTSCTLREAFPIAITQVPLSWSMDTHAISLNVTFCYTEYSYNFYGVKDKIIKEPFGLIHETVTIPATPSNPMSDIRVTLT
jgi:hypothetical protein